MARGWIKLYRSSFENKLYFAEPFTKWQAWTDLILLANHKDGFYFNNGRKVLVPRGSVGRSGKELAQRWGWSINKVFRFLHFLNMPDVRQVNLQKNNVTTLITILNYDKYQKGEYAEWNADEDTDGTQTETYKNVKESLVRLNSEKFLKNGTQVTTNGNQGSGEDLYAGRYGASLPGKQSGKKNDTGGKG